MDCFHIYQANIFVVLVKQVRNNRHKQLGTAESSDISIKKKCFFGNFWTLFTGLCKISKINNYLLGKRSKMMVV